MTGILTSMGANKLELRQGDINTVPNGVATLDPDVLANAGGELAAVVAGCVMSKTAAGHLTPGILATPASAGSPLPLFLWFGHDENTANAVVRDRGMPGYGSKPVDADGNPEGIPFWGVAGNAVGDISGPYSYIIGGCGMELTTTRFDADASYAVGQPVTAVSAAAAIVAQRGVIRPLVAATDVVVGVVTGRFTSPDGYDTLALMALYTPGTTVAAEL